MRSLVAVSAPMLWIASAHDASATGVERPDKDLRIDPALCLAAALARDDDRTENVCGALIDNAKTEKPDRMKALMARAAVYERKDMTDRAIADYDSVLRLDPALADIHNARGELWRKKGDLPKAVADFAAAIKLNPEHRRRQSQPPVAGAGAGAAGGAEGGRGQAEFQLRHRPAHGGKGDLRQPRACRPRPGSSRLVMSGPLV